MKTRTRYRRTLAAICVLGALLRAPALIAPPVLDDHIQAAMLDGTFPARRAWWDLYAFAHADPRDRAALRAEGTLPWWTADDYQLVMVRPLSSALVAFDHHVLRHWTLARVHSLLWFVALVGLTAAFVRRRVGDRAALLTASVLVADDAWTTPIAWHANRCALVAVVLALAALARLDRPGSVPRNADLVRATAFALLALFAGEYAWTLLPAIAFLPRGLTGGRRAVALVVLASVGLGLRWLLGGGTRGCALYPDISSNFGMLLFVAPRWWAATLSDFVAGVSVEHQGEWLGLQSPRAVLVFASLVLSAIVWRAMAREDPRRSLMIGALWAGVASLALVSTAWLSARLMVGATICSAITVGALIDAPAAGRFARLAAIALWILHVPVKGIDTFRLAWRHRAESVKVWREAARAPASASSTQTLYVLNALDPWEVYFGRYAMRHRGIAPPRGWFVLSSTHDRVHLYRESDRTFSLVCRTNLLSSVTAMFFRSGVSAPAVGRRARVGEATLTVLDADATSVRRVRIEFDHALDDPGVVIAMSTPRGLERVSLPAVGGSIELGPPRLSLRGP